MPKVFCQEDGGRWNVPIIEVAHVIFHNNINWLVLICEGVDWPIVAKTSEVFDEEQDTDNNGNVVPLRPLKGD